MEPSAASDFVGTTSARGPGNNDDAPSRLAANDPEIQGIIASHRKSTLSILRCDRSVAKMDKLREKSLWAMKNSMRAYDVSVLQGLLEGAEEGARALQGIANVHYNEALAMLRSNAAALAALRAQNLSKMTAAASFLPCTTKELLALSEHEAMSFFHKEQGMSGGGASEGGHVEDDGSIQQFLGRDASGVEEWLHNALSPKPNEHVSPTGSYGYEVGKTMEAEGPPANPIVPYATPFSTPRGGDDGGIQQFLGRDASGVEEWLHNALSPKHDGGKAADAEGPPANPILPYHVRSAHLEVALSSKARPTNTIRGLQFHENAEYVSNSDRETFLLCMPADGDILSSRQCFVRSHLVEIFVASAEDALARHSKGQQQINAGQVGVRCAYCACLKRKHLRAVCYPSTLLRLYQTIVDMQRFHFESCVAIPPKVLELYKSLKTTRPRATENPHSYWTKSAREIGLVDAADRGIQVDADGGMVMLEMQRKSTATGQLELLGVESQTVPGQVIHDTQMKELVDAAVVVTVNQPATAKDMNEANLASGKHVFQPSPPPPPVMLGTATALLALQSEACDTSANPPVLQGCPISSLMGDNSLPRSTTTRENAHSPKLPTRYADGAPVIGGTAAAAQLVNMTNGGAGNCVVEPAGFAKCDQFEDERTALLSWFDSTNEFGAPVVQQTKDRDGTALELKRSAKEDIAESAPAKKAKPQENCVAEV
ncbi:hypothetical protein ACHAXT_012589 [Thalassiosira profunda]